MSHSRELMVNGYSTEVIDDDLTDVNKENDDIPISIRSLFQYPIYIRFLFYLTLSAVANSVDASFLTGYGAAYFGGCHSIEMNNHCHKPYNYDDWNWYFNVAMTIQAFISFFAAPIIGGLSDHYGRKPFLIMEVVIGILPSLVMTFHNDMLLYIMLLILNGFSGPVSSAYTADVLC